MKRVQLQAVPFFFSVGMDGDKLPNTNVLKKSSKTPIVVFVIVIFLVLFVGITYITYCYNSYTAYHKIDDFTDFFAKVMPLVGEIKPKFDSLLIKSLKMQVTDLWYIYLIIFGLGVVMTTSNKNPYKNMEHGSARFATPAETKPFTKKTTGIPCGQNFYVPLNGKIGRRKIAPNLNEVVIGGSGAGKSFRKSQPDVMQMWGSYVITDPKGELYRNTAKMLKEAGYKIRVLNLIDIKLSDSYNPFVYMSDEQDVLDVCTAFMAASAGDGEKEDTWSNYALEMLTAISIYLFKAEDEIKSFGRVVRLTNSITYNRSGQIDQNCELARCLNRHSAKHPYDAASITWSGMQGLAQETASSIQKTLAGRLRLWAVEDVDVLTAQDDFDFDTLGDQKTVFFVIVPVPRNTYKAVANLFYTQLFQRLFRVGADKNHNGSFKELISFELDEFANIGLIPDFEKILAVVRSYNIRVCIILQDLSQLKALYKDTYHGIIANCAIFTFLGTTDQETLKELSEKLGNISVQTDSRSYNRTSTGGGNDTESHANRPLLNPDEIKEAVKAKGESIPYDGKAIIWLGYERPFYINKFDTIKHPKFALLGSDPKFAGAANNTDIEEIYGQKFAAKKAAHQAELEKQRNKSKVEEQEAAEATAKAEKQEQADLEVAFNQQTEHLSATAPLSDEEEDARDDVEFVADDTDDTDTEYDYGEQDSEFAQEYSNDINDVYLRILGKQEKEQSEESTSSEDEFEDSMAYDEDMPE